MRGQPLRAGSHIKGRCELGFYRPLSGKIGRYFDAAERFNLKYKAPGQHFGPLGPYGQKVYKALIRHCGRDGQLDPTLETLAKDVGACVSAVVAALKRLKHYGFINWIRRYTEVATRQVWGPQVKQTSNAYRIEKLPPEAEALADPAGDATPEDFAARKADKVKEMRQMEADENGVSDAVERLRRAVENKARLL